jgi:ABC-type transport system substrate-binding protein
MIMRPKYSAFLTLVLSLVLILVTAQRPVIGATSGPVPKGELKIGVPTLDSETFHPFWAPNIRKFYYEPLFDYLVGLDGEMNLVPGIATKWEEAPDHKSWTFWIRDGVTFHDGTPMTLEDVKFSLDSMLDDKNVCVRSLHKPYQDRVEIVPPDKVVIYLKEPWPVMPYLLSSAGQGGGIILPKKYIEEKGAAYFEAHPVGTGPYKFLEKKEGDFIKYEALNRHWRVGVPKYKYLTFKKMPEEGTRVASLEAGELDVIMVDRARAKELEEKGFPIVEKKAAADINLDFLRTYETNNPLHKRDVRKALVYAIDKEAILKHILLGRGKTIGHCYYMFSTSIGYKDYPVTPYEPKTARELLAKAGYPNGFTMYLYSYATTVPEQKLICEAIAGYWQAIGLDVKILEMESGAFFPIWTKKKNPPGPAAFVHSWGTRPQASWKPLFYSDVKKFYFSQTSDTELDKLIDEFDKQVTLDGYIAATRKCEEYVLKMFYKSGIVNVNIPFATQKDVPSWNCGKGNIDSFFFETIGAVK